MMLCAPLTALPAGRPEWIHVMPFGQWKGYRPDVVIRFGPKEAKQAIANQQRWGIDVVIDFEHQTLNTVRNGADAPALGWIDRFEERPTGLWGHVREWTARGGERLDAREYRYLSPVLLADQADRRTGEPVGMHIPSVALTNNPFLAGDLVPVVARLPGDNVDFLTELKKLLGLAPEATEADILARVRELTPSATLRAQLGGVVIDTLKWGDKAPADAEIQLSRVLNHEGFVPAAELTKAQAATLTAQAEAERLSAEDGKRAGKTAVDALVLKALDSGKVTPALEAGFRAMATRDLAGATEWLDTQAQVVVPLTAPTGPAARRGPVALSHTEQNVCTQLGVKPADYLKARDARARSN